MWPKPLPNHWLLGSTIGVGVDSKDHVFIIHRGCSTLNQRTEAEPRQSADRGVLPRGAASWSSIRGNLVKALGRPGRRVRVAGRTTVSRSTTRTTCGSAGTAPERLARPQVHARRQVPAADRRAEASAYNSNSKTSTSVAWRRSRLTSQPTRHTSRTATGTSASLWSTWRPGRSSASGARMETCRATRNYGPITRTRRSSQQFRTPVHCAEPTNDGLVYVCDRPTTASRCSRRTASS